MTDTFDTSLPDPGALRLATDQMDWLQRAPVQRVFDVLERAGFSARVVGGAVRNALLNAPVADIDIATTATPEAVMSAAKSAGLAAHPTGLAHGTVTIVANDHPFEVTTLRRDVEPVGGRHAVVAFTTDWKEDAQRRDFTINALYCDRTGLVFDPLDGYQDIVNARVRFIGDAHERIREDYLRILRFFRFCATYTEGEMDEAGLAACVEMRAGLKELSRERIGAELLRLIAAPHALTILATMAKHKLVQPLVGGPVDVDRLSRLIELDKVAPGPPSDALLRLSALCLGGAGEAATLARLLRLSSEQKHRLSVSACQEASLRGGPIEEPAAKALLYRLEPTGYVDQVRLAWADAEAGLVEPATSAWADVLQLPERWQAPSLPVSGADVMALDIPAGPMVGEVLRQFEDWWVAAGFPDEPAKLSAQLTALAELTHR